MEGPRKHEKKKNAINLGGGRFGTGGIVLFGGALVTATITIVSAALALKAKRLSKNSRSPSQETQNVSLGSKNQSDEASSMKEMQSKSIEELSRENDDEKVESGNGIMKEERYVDSLVKEKSELGEFECSKTVKSAPIDNYYNEKKQQTTQNGSKNQRDEASSMKEMQSEHTEEMSHQFQEKVESGDGIMGEERYYVDSVVKEKSECSKTVAMSAAIDEDCCNEKKQQSVSIEAVTRIEGVWDEKEMATKAGCVHDDEVKEKDCGDEIIVANWQGELNDKEEKGDWREEKQYDDEIGQQSPTFSEDEKAEDQLNLTANPQLLLSANTDDHKSTEEDDTALHKDDRDHKPSRQTFLHHHHHHISKLLLLLPFPQITTTTLVATLLLIFILLAGYSTNLLAHIV